MGDINLLPQQKKEPNYGVKIGSSAKKYVTYATFFLIIIAVIYGAIYGFFFVSSSVSTSSTEQLESDIKALQATEQKIVLIRDRAAKSAKVLAADSADDESLSFITISSSLPEGVTIQSSELLPTELKISVVADRSQQVGEFIRSLVNSKKYARIELLSMDFNPKDRYLAEIKLVNLEANN